MTEIPWFWPGAVLTFWVGLALGERVARALTTRPTVGAVLVIGVGIVVSATLTPGREAVERGAVGLGSCDLTRVGLASAAELIRLDETMLNVLLFMPLGLALGWLPSSWRKAVLVLAAAAAPVAIEGLQMLLPAFDRACESADVIDNLTGLALALAAGTLTRRWLAPHGRAPDIP